MMLKRLAGVAVLSAATSLFAFSAMAEDRYDSSRVVSIGGSLTEIVYALGEEGRLIARDSTSTYPEQALDLPDVGYMRALSPEGVLSVSPSLIIALEGSGPQEAIDVLEKASVPMVLVPETWDREGILAKIHAVGTALNVEDKAEKLAEKVNADVLAAEKATADISERKKVLFVLSLQGGRVLASGINSAADGIIVMAGGINAVTDYQGYKQLTDEAVIESAPDMILAMDRGGDHAAAKDQLLAHTAIAATPAGRTGNIVRIDGSVLLGFGPRTAEAVRELSEALYGDDVTNN